MTTVPTYPQLPQLAVLHPLLLQQRERPSTHCSAVQNATGPFSRLTELSERERPSRVTIGRVQSTKAWRVESLSILFVDTAAVIFTSRPVTI